MTSETVELPGSAEPEGGIELKVNNAVIIVVVVLVVALAVVVGMRAMAPKKVDANAEKANGTFSQQQRDMMKQNTGAGGAPRPGQPGMPGRGPGMPGGQGMPGPGQPGMPGPGGGR